MRDRALIALALATAGCGRLRFDELPDGSSNEPPSLVRLDGGPLDGGDRFGQTAAISGDGNTIAVGAIGADGTVPGDNSIMDCGAVYVFVRDGLGWTQQAYVAAPNPAVSDFFGLGVALSGDGDTLAIGTPNQGGSGAVYVYARSGTTWTLERMIKDTPAVQFDAFGNSVSLSADGQVLAVAATYSDASLNDAGALRVFARSGGAWTRAAALDPATPMANGQLGQGIVISGDGHTIAGGAPAEIAMRGTVHVFAGSGTAWAEQAALAPVQQTAVAFGFGIGLSADGNVLAAGAPLAAGITTDTGVVHVFARSGSAWALDATIEAPDGAPPDHLGFNLALSANGRVLAVGAEDDSRVAPTAGSVRIFERSGTAWTQRAHVPAPDPRTDEKFGDSIAISANGETVLVGSRGGTGGGAAHVFE